MYDHVGVEVLGTRANATKLEAGVGTVDTVCDPGERSKSGTVGLRCMCEDKEMRDMNTLLLFVLFLFLPSVFPIE